MPSSPINYLRFIQMSEFQNNWIKLGLSDSDLRALELEIMKDPAKAKVVQGTGGLRTVRFSPKNWKRGKSGATRVMYVFIQMESIVFLMSIYTKSEKESLTSQEKNELKELVSQLRLLITNR